MSTTGNGNGNGGGAPLVRVPQAGEIERQEFGATALERRAETSASTLAAQATASVQARFIMAMQRPRNIDTVRTKILAACKRPTFAKMAIYAKPIGMKKNPKTGKWEEAFAEGLNIRFAEEAIRNLGNAMTESSTIYDDPKKRIIRLSASDLETNVVHYKDITVEKTVERRKPKEGQVVLGQRINSYNEPVFIVEATEDDMLTKVGAASSKALRDKILMLIPSDIQEDARAMIYAIQAQEDAKDPSAAKKAMIDAFSENGIMPEQLTEYIGHDLGALAPAELVKLRAIFSAIKDGEATWADVIGQKRDFEKDYVEKAKAREAEEASKAAAAGGGQAAPADPAKAAAKGKANLNDVAAASKAKRESAGKPATAARQPGEDDEDAANRAAAAPSADELPPWAGK